MGVVLEFVRKGIERRRLPEAVGEGLGEQPIGEPRVPRQQRAVEIRSDGKAETAALEAILAVVAVAAHHPAEGHGG